MTFFENCIVAFMSRLTWLMTMGFTAMILYSVVSQNQIETLKMACETPTFELRGQACSQLSDQFLEVLPKLTALSSEDIPLNGPIQLTSSIVGKK